MHTYLLDVGFVFEIVGLAIVFGFDDRNDAIHKERDELIEWAGHLSAAAISAGLASIEARLHARKTTLDFYVRAVAAFWFISICAFAGAWTIA